MARKLLSLLGVVWCVALLFPPPAAQAQDETTWLLNQINTLRAGLGLPPYALNAQLTAAATQHSQYMAAGCDITHVESNGSTPQSRAAANGYGGTNVSENIYGGGIARASDAWDFWIHSPVHYAGLTSDYENEVGIGIASGLCNTYTLDFGHSGGAAAAQPASGPPAAPPAPTRYIPPPATFTPTPTILTLTPSVTWTLTPTHTPSAAPTLPPPTATASPTWADTATPPEPTVVAFVPSATETPSPLSPTVTPVPPSPTPGIAALPATRKEDKGFEVRDLIPLALVGQVMLIGLAGFAYFRRSR